MIPAVFEPFLIEAPFCVLAPLSLENLFHPQRLDALFHDSTQRHYHKELLFSPVVELMLAVVLRLHPSCWTPSASDKPPWPSAIRPSTTNSAAWKPLSRRPW